MLNFVPKSLADMAAEHAAATLEGCDVLIHRHTHWHGLPWFYSSCVVCNLSCPLLNSIVIIKLLMYHEVKRFIIVSQGAKNHLETICKAEIDSIYQKRESSFLCKVHFAEEKYYCNLY